MSIFVLFFCLSGRFVGFQGTELRNFELVLSFVAGGHSFVAICAFFSTEGGTKVDGDFSPDCIWFNALMAFIYVLFVISCFI